MKNKSEKYLASLINKQSDSTDCGVACLSTIIRFHNGQANNEKLRALCGTSITGTTLLGLHNAATQTGFDAEAFYASANDIRSLQEPMILHFIIDKNQQHFVVYFGSVVKQGKVLYQIGDPARGLIEITDQELNTFWKTGACLTLTPNSKFINIKEINNKKRIWLKTFLQEDFSIILTTVFLGVIIAILNLTFAFFNQKLIDDILPSKNYNSLLTGLILFFLVLLLKSFLNSFRQYLLISQSRLFNIRIVKYFYESLIRLPKAFYDSRKMGDITTRLNDTARIQRIISQIVGSSIIDILITLITLIALFNYSISTGIFCSILISLYFILIYLFKKNLFYNQREMMASNSNWTSHFISSISGIHEIKNFVLQTIFERSNLELFKNFQNKNLHLGKLQIKLSLIFEVIGIIFLSTVLFNSSFKVLDNKLKVGELIAILTLLSTLLPSITNLSLLSIPISEARIAFNRMEEFTEFQSELPSKGINVGEISSFRINRLFFRYIGRKILLKDISLEVKKGEIISIIGESGSGKTTLIQLIQRHYELESGEILLNDSINVNSLKLDDWRQNVGVVTQDIHLFNGTILENIFFGDINRDKNDILQFLEEYKFSNYFKNFPQSYMTLVGEDGINISGGQKQLIAIARALYTKPQILLLDEATSAMDRETERFVIDLLLSIKDQVSIIFITHRLNILKQIANKIYVIEDGSISCAGNHDSLISGNNLYSRYWADFLV